MRAICPAEYPILDVDAGYIFESGVESMSVLIEPVAEPAPTVHPTLYPEILPVLPVTAILLALVAEGVPLVTSPGMRLHEGLLPDFIPGQVTQGGHPVRVEILRLRLLW